jgi:hypothetical protein
VAHDVQISAECAGTSFQWAQARREAASDFPAKSRLKMQAARLNCNDRIHFEGFVEDPRAYLRRPTFS